MGGDDLVEIIPDAFPIIITLGDIVDSDTVAENSLSVTSLATRSMAMADFIAGVNTDRSGRWTVHIQVFRSCTSHCRREQPTT